jgi:hypothetical protein
MSRLLQCVHGGSNHIPNSGFAMLGSAKLMIGWTDIGMTGLLPRVDPTSTLPLARRALGCSTAVE